MLALIDQVTREAGIEMALDFVGEGDDGIEADHLDRTRRLVDVSARVLERGQVLARRTKDGERFQPARQRLVDLTLHPGQRAQVEVGCGVGRHGRSGRLSKNRARTA